MLLSSVSAVSSAAPHHGRRVWTSGHLPLLRGRAAGRLGGGGGGGGDERCMQVELNALTCRVERPGVPVQRWLSRRNGTSWARCSGA
jgi:hypothetical protein